MGDRQVRPNDAVYAQQVLSSYTHLPLTLSVSILNSLLLGAVLSGVASASIILIWIGLMVAQASVRMLLWFTCSRPTAGARGINPWLAPVQAGGSLFSGILWGSAPFIFQPLDEAHLLFVVLMIVGMCAGAATVHAAYFPAVVAFICPAVLPLAAKFLIQGSRLQMMSGLMACVFGISLCVASLRFRSSFNATTRGRLNLNEANLRLTAEIASHRSTEAKLQHSQRLESLGRLTAGVAHDFNNLLMSISGAAGLIAIRLSSDATCSQYLTTIMQSVERGANLTRRLLAFGRRQELVPRSVDINEMLQSLEKLLLTTLGGHSSLVLQLQHAPTVAIVDAAQLEHAILNLVINARDAMPQGGIVTIKTESVDLRGTEVGADGLSGKFVRIAVSDTGIGMAESVRAQAFDPFFTTKDIGEGSGLGLSQVYGLVQQSGGFTHIDSEVGYGTTVILYLPQGSIDPAHDRARAPEPAASVSPGRRILVLDDDAQVRETIAGMLTETGYTVVACSTAGQALDEIREPKTIDLMIVDVAMPGTRGDQFAAEARVQRAGVPIVFITGYARPTSLASERFVLRKPFNVASLISTIEEAMRTSLNRIAGTKGS
jgi:signal transduction histidine kinase